MNDELFIEYSLFCFKQHNVDLATEPVKLGVSLFKRTLGFWFPGGALPSNRPMGDVPLDGVAFSMELLGWVAHFRPGFWDKNVPVIRDFKP